jgi:hypothetical protein
MAVKTVYEPEEPDPFKDFSFAELLAFIHKTQFASGLRSLFSEFDSDYGQELKREYKFELWRETLIDAADELSLLNLSKCAAIVMEEVERRPSQFDRPPEHPATVQSHWRARQDQERKRWEQQRRYFLATGKRCGIIPPSVLASLPAIN